MSYFIAKWYLYIVFWRKTGKWPDKNWRRWVKQSFKMQVQNEKLARKSQRD